MAWKEACTFSVAVAVERIRTTGDARPEFVQHLSEGEKNSFWRIAKAEFGINRPTYEDDE